MKPFATALLCLILLSACTNTSCKPAQNLIQTQLYFGLSKPQGGAVTTKEWNSFVQREIAPRFTEGFTIVDGRGFWMGEQAKRVIAENSKLVVRIHEPTPAQDKAIEEIISDYKREFRQESVLRIDAPVCAKF